MHIRAEDMKANKKKKTKIEKIVAESSAIRLIFLFKRGRIIKKREFGRAETFVAGACRVKKIIWNSILATLLGTLALCAVLVFACVQIHA